eukprot:scaffold24080_cov142-Cylindrotheca_fusiformis.AAC.3
MASLIALDQDLAAIKSDVDKKVFECKRAQIVGKFGADQDSLDLKKAIEDAGAVFDIVRKEATTVRALKRRLNEAKDALHKGVVDSHRVLADAVSKVKAESSSGRDEKEKEFNIRMLRKKVEGAELHLQMGLKKMRKFEVFEKDLENATSDLLSVLATHQEKSIKHIVSSPAPEGPLQMTSLPSKRSTETHIVAEAIRQLMQERDSLRAELKSLPTTTENAENQNNIEMTRKLESEIYELKSELAALQQHQDEKKDEFSVLIRSNSTDTAELGNLETEIQHDENDEDSEDEDSYGFDDMVTPSGTMQALSTRVDREMDDICNAELNELNDIKLVQPDYEELIADQMRHEEELEEYAVQVLTLKETVAELQDDNRELREQLEAPRESSLSNEELEQLEAEVCVWKAKYEEASKSAEQAEELQEKLQKTRAKGERKIRVLQDDLETLQTEGSARIKSLMEKFKAFQAQGRAQVQSLQSQLKESQAEVAYLLKDQQDIAMSSSNEVDRLKVKLGQYRGQVKAYQRGETPSPPESVGEETEDDDTDQELFESDDEDGHPEQVDSEEEEDSQVHEGLAEYRPLAEQEHPEVVESLSEYEELSEYTDRKEQEESGIGESVAQGESAAAKEAENLRAELEALKETMARESARMSNEAEQLRHQVEMLQSEKDMKQEVIAFLQEQLDSAENALLQKQRAMTTPVLYSFESFDSETEAVTDDSSYN